MYESKPFVDLGRNSKGSTDITGMEEAQENSFEKSAAALALEIDQSTKEQMSPPGALKLTPHLEEKRIEHGIIDDCFQVCAEFDRILVYQLPASDHTFGKSGIIMPQASQKRVAQETPKGIIVSAGLGALDVLKTSGQEVGDTILFIKQGMWRIVCGWVRHVEVHLMVLSVGDICSNQDKAQRLREGLIKYHWNDETNEHVLVDRFGKRLKPQSPWVGADYE